MTVLFDWLLGLRDRREALRSARADDDDEEEEDEEEEEWERSGF